MGGVRGWGAQVALVWLCFVLGFAANAVAQSTPSAAAPQVDVHIYSQPGCPYCQRAKAFLKRAQAERDWLKVIDHNIEADAKALREFETLVQIQRIERPGVPLIVIGASHFIGFGGPGTTGADLVAAAERCRFAPCRSLRAAVLAKMKSQTATLGARPKAAPGAQSPRSGFPDKIELPFIGAVATKNLSLPVLTIVIAAVDGFNPCAMWVLIFLIGLLLGIENRVKMWILGGAFLLTSALVYFVFLAAWLNIFLFIGALLWVRLLVGGFAFSAGLLYLHEFAQHSEAYCRITNTDRRRRIMDAARRAIEDHRFYYALGGIIVLAAAVNLIELLCSAGLPAVFANVLSMSEMPVWQYYAYLLLYIAVFLADDTLIFVTAMLTLHATGIAATYSRISHLIGGCAMIVVGILLVFRPEWLAFV